LHTRRNKPLNNAEYFSRKVAKREKKNSQSENKISGIIMGYVFYLRALRLCARNFFGSDLYGSDNDSLARVIHPEKLIDPDKYFQ
jgi:hypothetical protein